MIAKKNLIKIQKENRRTYNKKCKQSTNYSWRSIYKTNPVQSKLKIKQKYLERYQVTKVKRGECYDVREKVKDYMKACVCNEENDWRSSRAKTLQK